ncbi:YqcC family protein [Vibrio sp. D404a]|uniref:YqcC family protein n=1 Tax=unclassified Vibrio TaxID=2614977 RepID=UPI002553693E|nr:MULTISPECIES: YqcC family protein [unclassified Vibrio]MDK9738597.1 YqcC family protein [Vibrio sp. D404a]MDK9795591.1 YqcC family protein [Vibrio sp. D449a]
MTATTQLFSLLQQLELQLQHAQLWSQTPPSDEALASSQPFAIDTLEPEQWLQWIFIAKIKAMIATGAALPKGFSIAPYFAEVWKNDETKSDLLVTIKQIDEVCA